jgi:hypothetical protein
MNNYKNGYLKAINDVVDLISTESTNDTKKLLTDIKRLI